MDAIVWDSAAMERIAEHLRDAAAALEDSAAGLRRIRVRQHLALRSRNGTVARRLEEETERCLRTLDALGERTAELTAALRETMERIDATERSLRRMAELCFPPDPSSPGPFHK